MKLIFTPLVKKGDINEEEIFISLNSSMNLKCSKFEFYLIC
jgi:hypothetical protein